MEMTNTVQHPNKTNYYKNSALKVHIYLVKKKYLKEMFYFYTSLIAVKIPLLKTY